jgi:Tol biopolymer transport system component
MNLSSRFACFMLSLAVLPAMLDGGIRGAAQFDASQGVYVAAEDGSGSTRIVDGGHHPAPSPDGTLIAYGTYGPNGTGINVAGWDGSGAREVVAVPAIPLMPSWSPDGKRIAYLSYGEAPDLILSVVNLDGSGLIELAAGGQTYPYRPSWSPDGSQIAFVGSGTGGSDLWVINSDGTGAKQLTDLPGQTEGLAFSPDGTLIAFSEQDYAIASQNGLYVVRPDGSGPVALTQWTANEDPSPTNIGIISSTGPAWSLDSAVLAVPSIQGVALVQADGSGAQILITGEFAQAHGVAYSPDGGQLALSYYTEDEEAQLQPGDAPSTGEYEDIYVMNVDGSGLMPVGTTALVDLYPLGSPDGARIVFSNESPGN